MVIMQAPALAVGGTSGFGRLARLIAEAADVSDLLGYSPSDEAPTSVGDQAQSSDRRGSRTARLPVRELLEDLEAAGYVTDLYLVESGAPEWRFRQLAEVSLKWGCSPPPEACPRRRPRRPNCTSGFRRLSSHLYTFAPMILASHHRRFHHGAVRYCSAPSAASRRAASGSILWEL